MSEDTIQMTFTSDELRTIAEALEVFVDDLLSDRDILVAVRLKDGQRMWELYERVVAELWAHEEAEEWTNYSLP